MRTSRWKYHIDFYIYFSTRQKILKYKSSFVRKNNNNNKLKLENDNENKKLNNRR